MFWSSRPRDALIYTLRKPTSHTGGMSRRLGVLTCRVRQNFRASTCETIPSHRPLFNRAQFGMFRCDGSL